MLGVMRIPASICESKGMLVATLEGKCKHAVGRKPLGCGDYYGSIFR
jgi:hypothetical protein